MISGAVELLKLHCKVSGIPEPEEEFRFHPERKWRSDLAWKDFGLLVEVDGGVFVQGGHTRGMAYQRDREKDAEALCLGWRVLRVTPNQVKNGQAVNWIERIMKETDPRS